MYPYMDPMYMYGQPEQSYNNIYGQQQYSNAHDNNLPNTVHQNQAYDNQNPQYAYSQNNYQQNNYSQNYSNNYDEKKKTSDLMPHPLTVNYKDYEKYYGQTFDTSAQNPVPLVSTKNVYFTHFKNSSPNFIRSTLYACPNSNDVLKKSSLPFALIINPFSTNDNVSVPIVDHGSEGPVRCRRCRAYVNPHVQFINGGKNFKCNLCACVNDVPDSYFCNVDQTGQRLDYDARAELIYGSYDLLTNSNYCRNNSVKTNPVILFLIDVSYSSVSSGLVKQITHALSNLVTNSFFDEFCNENGLRIGILGYDTQIYVFIPKETDSEMEIIFDLDEPFISSFNTFLINPVLNKNSLLNLLSKIPDIFLHNKQTDIILGPVLNASVDILINNNCCGKLVTFHSNMPNYDTQGKLKHVEERAQLGSEDEKRVLAPQTNYYTNLAQKFVDNGIGIDLMLFPNGPTEIASLSPLCSLTGGNLKLFKYFKSSSNGSQLLFEIENVLRNSVGFDTMAKLRTSAGISIKSNFGHFSTVNENEILMSTVDTDSTICVELCHDEKVSDVVFFQFAILYTALNGKRLIRIHNLSIKIVDNIIDIFKNADNDAISLYFLRLSVKNLLETSVSLTKSFIISFLVRILASYRKNCASSSSPMQLVLPENIKLLPLYINVILNSDAINGGKEMIPDDKSFALFSSMAANLNETNAMLYPRLFDILSLLNPNRELNPNFEAFSCEYCIPHGIVQVRSSAERLSQDKVYLLENGTSIYLWFGKSVPQNIFGDLFGVGFSDQYFGVVMDHLPGIDSNLSKCVSNLIAQIRHLRRRYMRVIIGLI